MGLNQYQANAVQVSLRMLEDALLDIERLMHIEPRGVLHRTVLDIPCEQRTQIMELSRQAQQTIAELANQFELQPVETSVRQIVAAELSSAWENLEDTRPSALRRYGNVDPALEQTLGPSIERLIQLVLAMDALVRQTPANNDADS